MQVCRAVGVLRIQPVDERDDVLAVARVLPQIDIGINHVDWHPGVAEASQLELIVASARIEVSQLEAGSTGVDCQRQETIRAR